MIREEKQPGLAVGLNYQQFGDSPETFSRVDFGLSYEEFRRRFEAVNDLRDKALFATIYCGYARVGEIVRGKVKKTPALNRDQVKFLEKHMLLTILTEKTGQWRKVPTNREKEGWLHDPIIRWLDHCDYYLFPYSTFWAEKKFQKWFGTQRIHFLRHWATTHALQGKRTRCKLLPQYVARLGGWTNLNAFYKTYAHFTVEDYIDDI